MLSKKYYIAFANLLCESATLEDFTDKLIYFLKVDNTRFDPTRFRKAVINGR